MSNNDRESLVREGLARTDEDKLEKVLDKWIDSRCSEVTWDHLIHVLEVQLQNCQLAEDVKRHRDRQR